MRSSQWRRSISDAQRKYVRPGLPDSCEALFHDVGAGHFVLLLRDDPALKRALERALERPRLQRAIGVIYLPESERLSHYFHTRLPGQFDAVIHMDETRALEPLEQGPQWMTPETYPSGVWSPGASTPAMAADLPLRNLAPTDRQVRARLRLAA